MLELTGKMLPLYYKVKPFDWWTGQGAYVDALRKHEGKQKYDLKAIGKWINVVSDVADISNAGNG